MARILQTDSIETSDLTASSQIKAALGTPTTPSICASSDTDTGLVFDGGNQISLVVGGGRKLTIIPDGRIGVNTEVPTADLEVNGLIKADVAIFDDVQFNTLNGDFTILSNTATINPGAITTNKIDTEAVTTDKLSDDAVTTAKIDDQAVTNDKISNGTITSAKLNTDSVAALDVAQSFSKQHNFSAAQLSDDNDIDWDLDNAQIAYVTLQGDRILNNPTNQRQGGIYILVVKQDDVGGRSLSFGSDYIFPDNVDVQLNGVANRLDILSFISIGDKMYGTYALNYMTG